MNHGQYANQRILIVDDNPQNIEVIGTILRQREYKIAIANSGGEALNVVSSKPPDLILLDVRMPGMDGFELCRRLKANEATRDIPIIFLTAATEPETKLKGLELGAADYIVKPFDLDEVVIRVEKQLAIRNLHKQLEEKNAQLEQEIAERKQAEEALRESESFLKIIYDKAEVGIFVVQVIDEKDFIYTGINSMHETLIGITSQEIAGKRPQDLLPYFGQQAVDLVIQLYEKCVHTKQLVRLEHPAIIDGKETWWFSTIKPLLDDRGKVCQLIGTGMIITERKQAEEALRESEERYRVVVEDQTEMISRYLPNGTLTFVNDAFCRHINRQRENLLGQSWWTLLVSEEELERVQKHITSLSRKNPVISFESQVVAPDGKSLRWEQWTNRALFDEQGKIVEYQGIGCDITERKQAEEERDRFFRLSLDMLCIASVDGYFKRLNPAFEETLGFATEELLSQQFIDFIHPDDVASTRAEVEKQMAGVPTINFENRYRCKDGSYKWLSWKAVAYAEEGLLYAVARDITERKQAEGQLKAALDEKEILLKEVYHRVKNNMTGLEYLIEMQAEDNESPELVNAFEEFQGRVRAMGLVHQKLYQTTDLARIDFGEYLKELTAQLFNALGKNRPISLHVKAATIFVDARLAVTCGLIVNELVTNALKYAFPASFHLDEIEGGQANQEIHIAFEASEGEYILVVSDNGVGLPPELDWQATESLGMRLVTLWASYQLQGSIQVDTRNGTVFTLRFPKE